MTLLDDQGTTGSPQPPRDRRRLAPLVVAVVVLAVVVALGAAAVALVGGSIADRFSADAPDYPGPGSGAVTVEVPEGATLTSLAEQFVEADVVQSREAFLQAANSDERASGLQPGFYELRREMSAAGAIDLLFDPSSRLQGRIVIPEGLELEQIVDRLVTDGGFAEEDVRAAIEDPSALGLPDYAEGTVEGFLFPATYPVDPGATALSTLQQMVDAFVRTAEDLDLVAQAEELGQTPLEAVTVASLAQKEVLTRDDFTRVARVIDNRLEAGMPLQFDSTINYALPPEERGNPNYEQLRVESPYNTYTNAGLPPTPIGAPGREALEAALNPADGDWIYFITTDAETGETLFTADYDEFINAKNELRERTSAPSPSAGG